MSDPTALALALQVRAALQSAARDTDDLRDRAALDRAALMLAVAARLADDLVRALDAAAAGRPA